MKCLEIKEIGPNLIRIFFVRIVRIHALFGRNLLFSEIRRIDANLGRKAYFIAAFLLR
jgi:hypothetical protein